MIATGTDIRPCEFAMSLRPLESRVLFEQMKGRVLRVVEIERRPLIRLYSSWS